MAFHINEATNEVGTVWQREGDKDRFLTARDGDGWCNPFQCDWCWFWNLQGRGPLSDSHSDTTLLKFIRRVNLDIMWSREPTTVKANLTQLNKLKSIPGKIGLKGFDIPRGPWRVEDKVGFGLAIVMLRASQEKGRHDPDYVQFDTIRKLRSAWSNAHESSAWAEDNIVVLKGDKGKAYRLSSSPTESRLFYRFILGLESRMGRLVKSNIGLDVRILLEILNAYNRELAEKHVLWNRKRKVIMTGAYLVLCYGASLRGNEGLYLEGSSLVDMINFGRKEVDPEESHVCAPLLGRFKNEVGEDKHVALISNKTKSGINVRLWMERLVWLLVKEGRQNSAGPAFCNEDGTMMRAYQFNGEFHLALREVQIQRPDLLPEGTDIEGSYGTFRSLRRGSLTRATEQGIDGPDLDMVNRWRKFEDSKGSRPHMSMREHYLEIKLVLKRALVYSKAL